MEGRGGRGGDRKGPCRLCLQFDPDPNLYRKLNNTGSTQTNTILIMSFNPKLEDISNHVTATCVANSFPISHLNQMTLSPSLVYFLYVPHPNPNNNPNPYSDFHIDCRLQLVPIKFQPIVELKINRLNAPVLIIALIFSFKHRSYVAQTLDMPP